MPRYDNWGTLVYIKSNRYSIDRFNPDKYLVFLVAVTCSNALTSFVQIKQ